MPVKIAGPSILATSCSDWLRMSTLGPALSELSFEQEKKNIICVKNVLQSSELPLAE